MDIGLIQQGDVLFHRVDQLPEGAVSKPSENATIIFAAGESTGHQHSATLEMIDTIPNIQLYEAGGLLYIKINRDTEVAHQEHKPVILTVGIYRRGLVREIDPFSDEIRYVRD